MSEVFQRELDRYIDDHSSSSELSAEQVSFICYLYGETGDPSGKVQLLKLTQDQNRRILASAVNALGKLKTDSSDTEFVTLVSSRLREISEQTGSSKMLRKDIAFAFKKYNSDANIAALMKMLDDDYFASRFLSADCLASYGSSYYDQLKELSGLQYPNTPDGRIAFYMSLENADEELLVSILDKAIISPASDAEKLAYWLLIENRSKVIPSIKDNFKFAEFIESVSETTNLRIF
jgi:HEAT repeat protein